MNKQTHTYILHTCIVRAKKIEKNISPFWYFSIFFGGCCIQIFGELRGLVDSQENFARTFSRIIEKGRLERKSRSFVESQRPKSRNGWR